jgi:uncharacterized protein (TIGR03437 family)
MVQRGLVVAAVAALVLTAQGPCPYFVRTTPVILLNDGSNSVRLEVSGGSNATGVTWRPSPGLPFKIAGQTLCGVNPAPTFDLRDDGAGGDLKASDGVFTLDNIQFDPDSRCRTAGLLPETNGAMSGWFEYQIGTIAVKTASSETSISISTGYYTPLIVVEAQMYRALDTITPIDANTQRTAWLVNVRDDTLPIERGMGNLGPPGNITSAVMSLSRALTDAYDFRAFIATTVSACSLGRIAGQHIVVQSDITGNGERITHNSAIYQTGPKLLGLTFHANFVMGATGVAYHETMHQWGAYLDIQQLGLDDTGAHWLSNSSVAGSLGGCAWTDNGNGTFSTAGRQLVDGDLELYVAGLLPPSQVNPVYVASGTVPICDVGRAVPGPYRKVTVDDVVRVHGPRVPAWDGKTKNYRYALVVTSQNRLLTPLEMTYYGRIAQLWEGSTIELGAIPTLKWPQFTRGASTLTAVLDSWAGPLLRAVNVTNAASGQVGAVSPGEIIVLYGERLGPSALAGLTINSSGKVDTVSGGTRVLFDGVPAAMLYSSAGQVSAIVPYGVTGRNAVSVQLEYQGQLSPAISLPVAPSAPGIFTQDQSGRGPGAIRNQDNSVNTADNPAEAGSVIQIFGTGEGQSVPGGVDGGITPDLRSTQQPPSATIGGTPAFIEFAGPAPFAVAGLLQVNARVPAGLTPGPVPVAVKFGSASSQAGVTVFVK